MTPKEREWLTDYVAMMKVNLAICPGVAWSAQESNMAVIDRIVEVQIALNAEAAANSTGEIAHVIGSEFRK